MISWDEVTNKPIKVYIKTDDRGSIVAINSEIFIDDLDGWTEIDRGHGDKYAHAQNNYFDKPLVNENGEYNYKLVDGKAVLCAPEDKA